MNLYYLTPLPPLPRLWYFVMAAGLTNTLDSHMVHCFHLASVPTVTMGKTDTLTMIPFLREYSV